MKKYKTREQWLLAAINQLRPYFKAHGYIIPKKVKVSCGWTKSRKTATGETWSPNASKGKFHEIFISPECDNVDVISKDGVLSILVHELIHVVIGLKEGHKKLFKQTCKKLGLEGKATESTAGHSLCLFFKEIIKEIGQFPHRALIPSKSGIKKQTTRLLKLQCPNCDYIIRVTRKHLDEKGSPLCPVHKKPFEEI